MVHVDRRRPTRFLICGICIGVLLCYFVTSQYNLSSTTRAVRPRTLDELNLPVIIANADRDGAEQIFVNLSLIECPSSADGVERTMREGDLGCKKRLPQVIGLGPKGCGSEDLFFLLAGHPAIVQGPSHQDHQMDRRMDDIDLYRESMPVTSKFQLTVENNPRYFTKDDAPEVLRRIYKDMKFIVVLTDPVDRLLEDYLHGVDQVDRSSELEQWVPGQPPRYFINDTLETSVISPEGLVYEDNALVATGMYNFFLERWFRSFPDDQFFIVDGALFKKDPLPIVQRLEKFLGLPQFFDQSSIYFNEKTKIYCRQKPKRMCPISKPDDTPKSKSDFKERTFRLLREVYQPHNNRLELLLGQKLSWTNS